MFAFGWRVGAVAALATAAVALVGGLLTRIGPWYFALRKPDWQPPDWLFGPAWTVIFLLTAWAAALGWAGAEASTRPLLVGAFALNGVLNIVWSYLFFTRQRPDSSLLEVVPLWLSVLAMMAVLSRVTWRGVWLLVPYLVWVAFAAFLNRAVVRLNRPFT
jgi:tryptophan-rich sensory protein